MKLSTLILNVGDEHVQVQVQGIESSLVRAQVKTNDGEITFATDREKVAALAGIGKGTHKGLVVWLPVDRLTGGTASPAAESVVSDTPETDAAFSPESVSRFDVSVEGLTAAAEAGRAKFAELERQRNELAKILFARANFSEYGSVTERTAEARFGAYLHLLREGHGHGDAISAALRLSHLG